MKKIFSVLVIFAGLFALAPVAFAQEGGQAMYDKTISKPDENGVYTISLEAYVTGSRITTESLTPTDIVLCLAYNNSSESIIANLRKAVAGFINIIKEKNIVKDEDGNPTADRVGYRVALELYGVDYNKYRGSKGLPSDSYHTLVDVDQYVADETGSDGTLERVGYSGKDLFPTAKKWFTGNEKSEVGLERSYNILNDAGDLQDNAVVVFFTNGTPGNQSGGGWNEGADQSHAEAALVQANYIKGLSDEEQSVTVVSVGLYSTSTPDKMTDWLYMTSSDNLDLTATIPSDPYHDVSGKNSMLASANTLGGIFASIASSIGGDYNIGSASSVLIDIVSTSFTVSTDADLGQTTVWRVPCNDSEPGLHVHSFNDAARVKMNVVETQEAFDALTDAQRETYVILTVDEETGEVTVSGFDYGENWCGWDSNTTTGVGAPHGSKLVLEIPITANDDAVGGPAVQTNAPGSGLILKDADGNPVGEPIEFISPTVSLPVNIHITKTGLEKGESAKFMIERVFFDKDNPPTPDEYESLDWAYVSTVFVTNDGINKTITKVRGLPSEGEVEGVRKGILYRISEEGWSWSYTSTNGPMFTDSGHVDNPFEFENSKDKDYEYKIRHAESKVTNIFNGSATHVYLDSKNQR